MSFSRNKKREKKRNCLKLLKFSFLFERWIRKLKTDFQKVISQKKSLTTDNHTNTSNKTVDYEVKIMLNV